MGTVLNQKDRKQLDNKMSKLRNKVDITKQVDKFGRVRLVAFTPTDPIVDANGLLSSHKLQIHLQYMYAIHKTSYWKVEKDRDPQAHLGIKQTQKFAGWSPYAPTAVMQVYGGQMTCDHVTGQIILNCSLSQTQAKDTATGIVKGAADTVIEHTFILNQIQRNCFRGFNVDSDRLFPESYVEGNAYKNTADDALRSSGFSQIAVAMFRRPQVATGALTGSWAAMAGVNVHGSPVFTKAANAAGGHWQTSSEAATGQMYLAYLDSRQTNILGSYDAQNQQFQTTDAFGNGNIGVTPDGWFMFNSATDEAGIKSIIGQRPIARGRAGKNSRSPADVKSDEWQVALVGAVGYSTREMFFTNQEQQANQFQNYFGTGSGLNK